MQKNYSENSKPLWKRIGVIILLPVFGGVIARFAHYYFLFSVPEGYYGIWTWNSTAKLTYVNTATCLTQFEKSGGNPSDMDGVYWGSLQKERGKDYKPPIAVDGTRESFDHAMKTLMGTENAEAAGCYYVVIKGGIPVQAFWSSGNELLYYAERYAERFGQGEIEGDFYIGGRLIGSYPNAMSYRVENPPEWLKLTFSDRMRTGTHHLRENGIYYIIFISPLLIYLIIGSLIKFVKKPKKETPALENVRSDKIN